MTSTDHRFIVTGRENGMTNFTRFRPGSNPGLGSGSSTTNCLNHCTAFAALLSSM